MIAHILSRPTRLMLKPLGVDVSRAALCPSAEVHRMLWIAAMIIAVGIWQIFIYTSALHLALSPQAFRPELLLLATFFSALLQMAELSLFVRPIWDAQADTFLNENVEDS